MPLGRASVLVTRALAEVGPVPLDQEARKCGGEPPASRCCTRGYRIRLHALARRVVMTREAAQRTGGSSARPRPRHTALWCVLSVGVVPRSRASAAGCRVDGRLQATAHGSRPSLHWMPLLGSTVQSIRPMVVGAGVDGWAKVGVGVCVGSGGGLCACERTRVVVGVCACARVGRFA
jgi:hypothetical protein